MSVAADQATGLGTSRKSDSVMSYSTRGRASLVNTEAGSKQDLTFRELVGVAKSGWPFLLIFLSSIGGLVSAGVASDWIWVPLGLSIALLVTGSIAGLFVKPTYLQLMRAKEQLDQGLLSRQATYQDTLRTHLRDLLIELDVLTADTRISAYSHNGRAFVMITRFSNNPSLMMSGRAIYPQNQGLIAEAWQLGEACKVRLPEDPIEYASAALALYGLPREVTHNMTMRSRSLVGLRVMDGTDPIGVIILESTKRQRIGHTILKSMKTSSAWEAATRDMSASRSNLPDMLSVSEEGF
jgi:hypothetical protein